MSVLVITCLIQFAIATYMANSSRLWTNIRHLLGAGSKEERELLTGRMKYKHEKNKHHTTLYASSLAEISSLTSVSELEPLSSAFGSLAFGLRPRGFLVGVSSAPFVDPFALRLALFEVIGVVVVTGEPSPRASVLSFRNFWLLIYQYCLIEELAC